MAKSSNLLVKLTSTGVTKKGTPTGTYFVKKRNPKQKTEKLQFKKYDPRAVNPKNPEKIGAHVLFVEKKMPSHSA
jgi:large subunit ribosomal protein L33